MAAVDRTPHHPEHGEPAYLQIPALDIERSATFYRRLFGWTVETEHGSFEAPGLIGQFATEISPAIASGSMLWFAVRDMYLAMHEAIAAGGAVATPPQLDQGARWLVELDDPAGNRIGIVAPTRQAAPQTLIAVRDVEASSRFYQRLLGFTSDHGGAEYERLRCAGELVLQLHRWEVDHHHGPIGSPDLPVGNGVLLWFGEVGDFDGVVARAEAMGATVVRPTHRNPPSGEGNGPAHREIWLRDLDGYTVVVASPDGEAWEVATH